MRFTLRNMRGNLEDLGPELDGARHLGDAPREEVEGRGDWWAA